ncbi:MAG: ornithine carbamoyltransferase [Pseudomonadota bacterium]
MTSTPKHFLDISAIESENLHQIIKRGHQYKNDEMPTRPLEGKMLAMVFDKPSTRTRVSFDVGMRQLGGETIILSGAEMQLGRGETIADTARVLSRYVDAIMIRTTEHTRLIELAENATVPVINGLTDDTHPCQIMADVMTIEEKLGSAKSKKLAWTGDGNNVLNSLIEGAVAFGYEIDIAVPEGRGPSQAIVENARARGAIVNIGTNAESAVTDADCVITDTWSSMGFEDETCGHNTFQPYQVNQRLMTMAGENAIFMHCLPAHRGEEVTDEVLDGPQSVVFDEAENRLHVQKAILAWCFE